MCSSWPAVACFYWSPGSVTPLPLQAEQEVEEAATPHLSRHPISEFTVGPTPSPQRRCLYPRSNRVPTFVILSAVFTPILPKPIEERANSAATDLK